MRIDLNANLFGTPEATKPGKANARAAATSTTRGERDGDVAELSSDQARVRVLEARVLNFPEVRQAKVEALSRAIRHGSYEVTPEQTAEALARAMSAMSASERLR